MELAATGLGIASHAPHCTAFSTVHSLCCTQRESHLLSYMQLVILHYGFVVLNSKYFRRACEQENSDCFCLLSLWRRNTLDVSTCTSPKRDMEKQQVPSENLSLQMLYSFLQLPCLKNTQCASPYSIFL